MSTATLNLHVNHAGTTRGVKFNVKVRPAGESSSSGRWGRVLWNTGIGNASTPFHLALLHRSRCLVRPVVWKGERNRKNLEEGLRNGKEDVKKKKREREKRLLRSLLLTILERSAVARATSGTRDWYLEQRSSGIAAEDLMFGTHLGSTNTSHLFSCFSDTLPASSLQPTRSPYRETPRGWCPIFFYCFALVLHEP